jgi:hypothetical protein
LRQCHDAINTNIKHQSDFLQRLDKDSEHCHKQLAVILGRQTFI